jgi:hypothetical protein
MEEVDERLYLLKGIVLCASCRYQIFNNILSNIKGEAVYFASPFYYIK